MRRIGLLSLVVLSLCLVAGQPHSGLTYGAPRQQGALAKITHSFDDNNNPALWGRNVLNVRPSRAVAYAGGTASFSNGPYDWVNSTFTYNITGAPPNVCGTLYSFRNGSQLVGSNWICTNSSGNASAGPWSGSSNQTDTDIYIQWPDGSRTTGGDFHISDASPPTITIEQPGGLGVPTAFSGDASDVQWGTGFDFCFNGYSWISVTFKNQTTGKYYDHTGGYNSTTLVGHSGSPANFCDYGFNVEWWATPPPPGAHVSGNMYRWCVQTNDRFYNSNLACIAF